MAKVMEPPQTSFSSDLLTPEEERELLTNFWDCKTDLVRVLVRHFPEFRDNKPPLEPWPMAQFIREFCHRRESWDDHPAIRRLHDKLRAFQAPAGLREHSARGPRRQAVPASQP